MFIGYYKKRSKLLKNVQKIYPFYIYKFLKKSLRHLPGLRIKLFTKVKSLRFLINWQIIT